MFPNRLAAERSLRRATLLGCVLLALPVAALALPEDRDQPIRITADQALRDEKQGFTVYSGNVNMDQGTLHIDADKITVYHMEEEADRIDWLFAQCSGPSACTRWAAS